MRGPLGADEGYLWYGVQQWLKGRMPHRDFRSYEPGRYVWSGAFARVFGDGLLALRVSTHLFFACALVAALVLLRRAGIDWWTVGAAAVALAVLSHPQHKQFEHAGSRVVRRRSTYRATRSTSRFTASPIDVRQNAVCAIVCGTSATSKPASSTALTVRLTPSTQIEPFCAT